MSFHTFPASLPFVAALHDKALLDEVIDKASREKAADVMKHSTPELEAHPHLFMDALKSHGNRHIRRQRYRNMQKTVNGANAYRSTLDSCLDLFNTIGTGAPAARVQELLENAWKQDPLATLHIIFHARSIHCGKSANSQFYIGFGWLLQHHPKTAILNLHVLVDGTIRAESPKAKDTRGEGWDMMEDIEPAVHFKSHGFWKDLLNVAVIYVGGELGGPKRHEAKFSSLNSRRDLPKHHSKKMKRVKARSEFYETVNALSEEAKAIELEKHKKMIVAREENRTMKHREKKLKTRQERQARISTLLTEDPCYQALHCTIARLFAHQLQRDLEQLQDNKMQDSKERYAIAKGISLAAKWAPTLAQSHDKHTLLATSIAEILFPPEIHQDAGESREHYLNKVRELYRKVYISPLREALDITERLMSLNQWQKIDFSHVPSKSMRVNRKQFYKHYREGFAKYLKDVTLGKRSVSGATLQPHELVQSAACQHSFAATADSAEAEIASLESDLVNSQWKTLVSSITSEHGQTLGECLAVCDQSGSMTVGYGGVVPMWSALGLGLIMAALAKPPFAGTLIAFAEHPAVITVDPQAPLTEQITTVQSAPVGFSTNLEAVFLDLLLPMAQQHNLRREDMVKRLYILSDMEFNQGTNIWETQGAADTETLYDQIKRKYEECGYDMPEIVWWNLAAQRPTLAPCFSEEAPVQVTKNTKGCAMLSGYSASMLKSFLEGKLYESEDDGTVKQSKDEDDGEANHSEDENNDAMTHPKENDKTKLDPVDMMKKAIFNESFNDLVLYD